VQSQKRHFLLSNLLNSSWSDINLSIYCLLGDLNCIAGSTSKNGVFIWDIGKKKIVKKFTEVSYCICIGNYTVREELIKL